MYLYQSSYIKFIILINKQCLHNKIYLLMQTVTYSAFCVDEEIGDLCDRAITLTEEWRGTTVDRVFIHIFYTYF